MRKYGLILLSIAAAGCGSARPAQDTAGGGSDGSAGSSVMNGGGTGGTSLGNGGSGGATGGGGSGGAGMGCMGAPMPDSGTGGTEVSGQTTGLVPKPKTLTIGTGAFVLSNGTPIVASDPSLTDIGAYLQTLLQQGTGFTLPLAASSSEPCAAGRTTITLALDSSITTDEGYKLEVAAAGVSLRAKGAAGVARGVQTLRQLFPGEIESGKSTTYARWNVPAVTIDDAPRLPYRGQHLDVSRHFFSVDFVKRYIDLLAFYKLNTFHFHLTDDQGFRMEIKKYPKLTQVGGTRNEGGTPYSGFYTQDQLRDLVKYAAVRGVTIIPEIEMPGHATAALAAYPEYACTPGPFQVVTTWGIFNDIFCPYETTFTFLDDILTEVFDVFPSHYVHVGGDEVPPLRWQQSAAAQQVIKDQGLGDEVGLEGYFIKRIQTFAESKGRAIIGWDDIVGGKVPNTATVMAWHNLATGTTAAQQGYNVIMAPASACYFDHYQANPATEPQAQPGQVTLATVYGFNPVPTNLDAATAAHIVGSQGQLWSEYVSTNEHAEYMTFPRASALAEVLWSDPSAQNFGDFQARLVKNLDHFTALSVNYAKVAVSVTVPESPYTTPIAIPGAVEGENYDKGGEGVSYHDTGSGNQAGAYRMDDVDVEATAGGGYDVGYIDSGEWLKFTVQIATAGTFTTQFKIAAPATGGTLHLEIDGAAVGTSFAVPSTGAWTTFTSVAGPSVTLPQGAHQLRIVFDNAGFNFDSVTFSAG